MFGIRENPAREDRDEGSDENDSDYPHSWLGHKNLLQLLDPSFCGNYKAFLKEWKKERPIIISHITKKLDMTLWNPTFFSQGYGECKVNFVNVLNDEVIPGQRMRNFWAGFEDLGSRPKDTRGRPMLLKLKEWPKRTMFESVLPAQMGDLLRALPLSSCTHPNGLFNFANFLPTGILTDELCTELHCAYGTPKYPWVGTNKLNINKFDSLNILVYVGKITNEDNVEDGKKVFQAVKDAGCDQTTMERIKKNGDLPGAIWHVYDRKDSKKINDLLKTVNFSRGILSQSNQNLINGENWYLDGILRGRLHREYGVEAHAILHCLGDAVIIPAGAPHQIRYLKSCIMVKHAFVSLQNMKKL